MALTPRINEKTPPRTPYCICIFDHVFKICCKKMKLMTHKQGIRIESFKKVSRQQKNSGKMHSENYCCRGWVADVVDSFYSISIFDFSIIP